MTYDVHPMFVHFPIAFLFVYSVLKILPFERWFESVPWRAIQRVLLVVGIAGAFVSLATGEEAAEISNPTLGLVIAHEFFAQLATWLYVALFVGELANFLSVRKVTANKFLVKLLSIVETVLTQRVLSTVIVIVALFALVVTGILGGAMVYGVQADPLASVVIKLLGLKI